MYFKYKKEILLAATLLIFTVVLVYNISYSEDNGDTTMTKKNTTISLKPDADGKIRLTDDEWKQVLTDEEYRVLRGKGTELCGTGTYYHNDSVGTYLCAGCGYELFTSDTKYNSGSGWPAFFQPISESAIDLNTDTSFAMVRKEVICSRCEGHLGHVFDDGPNPTGLRYCINSVSLKFVADKK